MTGREYWLKLFTENETALASAVILIERFVDDAQLASGAEKILEKKEELRKEIPSYRVELTFPDFKKPKPERRNTEVHAYKKTVYSVHLNTDFTELLSKKMAEAMVMNEDYSVSQTFGDLILTFQLTPFDREYLDARESNDYFTIYMSPLMAHRLHRITKEFKEGYNEGDPTLMFTEVVAGYTIEFHYTINKED